MARPVQFVSFGEDYTVLVEHGFGSAVDFDIYEARLGDLAYVTGNVAKVRQVSPYGGERPDYRVRLVNG